MLDQQIKKYTERKPIVSSFFDDDDPHASFEFVKFSQNSFPKIFQNNPIKCNEFKSKNLITGQEQSGYYALYDGYIAYCSEVILSTKSQSKKFNVQIYELNAAFFFEVLHMISNSICFISCNFTIEQYVFFFSKVNSIFEILEYLHIEMCILSPKLNKYDEFYFNVSKNKVGYQFATKKENVVEEWLNSMKLMCIHYSFHEEFKAIKMIGKGSFSRVYLAENYQSKIQYAVKACSKEYLLNSSKNSARASVLNEINILRHLNHDNVIRLHQVFETDNSLYMVIELIQGKTLEKVLSQSRQYNESQFKPMIIKILEVLAYLSSNKIMHRDLKPENILLDENDNIKIVDFGLSALVDFKEELIFEKCGTPGYIAPEIFQFNPENSKTNYDEKCDVFSAGCIFYYMLFGTKFFPGKNSNEILKSNRSYKENKGPYQTILSQYVNPNNKIPREALKLLLKMIESDPSKRISASMALEQPYLITNLNLSPKMQNIPENDSQVMDQPYAKSPINAVKVKNQTSSEPDNFGHESSDTPKSSYGSQSNSNDKMKNIGITKDKSSIYLNHEPPLLNGLITTLEYDKTPDSKSNSNFPTSINSKICGTKTSTQNHGENNQTSAFANSPMNETNSDNGLLLNIPVKKKSNNDNALMKATLLKNIQKNFDSARNENIKSPNQNSQYKNLGFSDYFEPYNNQFAVVEEESDIITTPSPDVPLNQKKLNQLEFKYIPSRKQR